MGTIKDFYDILKDLAGLAKDLKNQQVLELAMDLQAKYFEFKEENENLKDENKALKTEIDRLKQAQIIEADIVFSTAGFFTIKNENPTIPYCSACWKKDRLPIPLSRYGTIREYACSNCKSKIIVG